MRKIIIIIALALGLWAPVQAQATDAAYEKKLSKLYRGTVAVIEPEELQELIDSDTKILILDTRAPREYEVSHLEGARFVNFDKFKKGELSDIDPNTKVIVYCTVGYRSERIGEKLQKMGFEDVHNLYGGIFEWLNQGHEVVDEEGEKTSKVHAYNENWGQWLQNGEKIYR